MFISAIVSTYNSPDWLEKVVIGFSAQTHRDFELVIADDGSGPETAERIEQLRERTGLTIRHVWQEDDGFQKTKILNKAIREATGDYLLFTDGDCIPRADFLAVHAATAEPGHYLSGGYYKLPMETSHAITNDDITSGRAFDAEWLKAHGDRLPFNKRWKLTAKGKWAKFLNALTPTKPTWNGHNASGWREDIEAVNGFDERMQYGGEDVEMGLRLVNRGVEPKQIRYSAICIHLDHARGYVNEVARERNREIRRETVNENKTWTPYGLFKGNKPA
ncbi:MAG: glycosyltransferase family 2 protein [Gammaproteobacteria bacterium]|nr:glycosyltransferase family 2 protein [Gammaproteobacteria bacterium]